MTAPLQHPQPEIDEIKKENASLKLSVEFYRLRCTELQKVQSNMRDPERKWVCEILANGRTNSTHTHSRNDSDVLDKFVNILAEDLHIPLLSPDYHNAMKFVQSAREQLRQQQGEPR